MSVPDYPIEKREVVAKAEGLLVRIYTLARGQEVPWHHHSAITDTFVCLEGALRVQTRDPDELHLLQPGQTVAVPPGHSKSQPMAVSRLPQTQFLSGVTRHRSCSSPIDQPENEPADAVGGRNSNASPSGTLTSERQTRW